MSARKHRVEADDVYVDVTIRRVADGVERVHAARAYAKTGPIEDALDSVAFMWSADGNYGCDCNRYLFFQRAAGEPESDDRPCGDVAYRVVAPDWLADA